ncbi:MAG: hypothetical protein QXK49_03335 [Candidatus Aenigmatarchaeota archaeon]
MATDLVDLLFREILKIDPLTLTKYTTLSDQALYLFLIPHVILFLFLYAFSFGIVTRIVGQHKGFSYLVGIVSYIYIVYAGWYGKLVVWFLGWMYIALGMAIFLFLISIVFHPSATTAGMKLMGEVGKQIAKKTAKEHEKKAIEEEIESIKKQIAELENERARAQEPTSRAYIEMQIANLKAQKRALESKL